MLLAKVTNYDAPHYSVSTLLLIPILKNIFASVGCMVLRTLILIG